MTAVDPEMRVPAKAAVALEPGVAALPRTSPGVRPGRLRSNPTPRRHPLHDLCDVFAVALNRGLDRTKVARRIHRAHLARTEWLPLDLPLTAAAAHPDLDGLRVAFLTDLHAGAYLHEPELDALFGAVMARQPDLICFGGDLINTRAREIELFDRPLRRLSAPLGVYAVAGNHDHRWTPDIGDWQDFLETRGVQVLANAGLRLQRGRGSLWLAGVDDLTDGQPDLRRALWGRGELEPTVVLAHQPDHFREISGHGVDLVLSGHTHGGQIKPFGVAPIRHTRFGYLGGTYDCPFGGRSKLHVSRGVGVTILPLRMGARPEVTMVTLRAGR